MDISTHPVVVIIATLSSLIGVATSTWLSLAYIKRRWFAPFFETLRNLIDAVNMVPAIKAQFFNNGGSTLRDAVDRLNTRLCIMEAREKALIQEHDMAVFIADEDGRTTWVNRTYCRLFGVGEHDAVGYGWKNMMAPDERDDYTHEWESAVKDRREFVRTARCVHSMGGAEIVVKVRAYPMDSPGSTQRGYTGFIEPVENHTMTRVMGQE